MPSLSRRSLLRVAALGALACAALAPVSATAPAGPPVPVIQKIEGADAYILGFDTLSNFPYTITDAGTGATPEEISTARKRDQVPAWVRFYEGKRVALTGYMLPLQVERGLAKRFIMMRDITTCCYGATPNMNDYAIATMKGDGVTATQDVPVVLVGTLHIEEKYDNGYVTSLYEISGEKFLGPKK